MKVGAPRRRAAGITAGGSGVSRRLRLWSGLVLFVYAATHLACHAFGLVSLDRLDEARRVFGLFWNQAPAELALYLSLLVHIVMGLFGLWRRRSLRMPPYLLFQHATGLLIPFWLTMHLLGTTGLHYLTGMRTSYGSQFVGLWPDWLGFLTLLVTVVWLHGLAGVHAWLKLRPWYRRVRAPLLVLAVLLPVVAMLGIVSAGREFQSRAVADPAWVTAQAQEQRWPDQATAKRLVMQPTARIVAGFQWLLLLLLAGRGVRWAIERRSRVRLTYPGGQVVSVPRGLSVLEASRARGLPHAAICGGQGRCSTCRVRVGVGAGALPPPGREERRVLARIHAASDVRLACQLRPVADLTLTPLLPADAGPGDVLRRMDPGQGTERQVAVMFADLRAFTQFSEGRLPYDTVFVLNRYFAVMGRAIEAAGGRVDKFIGDGIMALFGIDSEHGAAARSALRAARDMALALEGLNRELQAELPQPLRMGIGLHLGPAIVGEMGYGPVIGLTAIGDTVNVASRLETLTKKFGAQLVVSDQLAELAGTVLEGCARHEVDVPGRAKRLGVRVALDASILVLPEAERLTPWWRRLLRSWPWLPAPATRLPATPSSL